MIKANNLILQISGPTATTSACFTNIGGGPNTYILWADGTISYAKDKPTQSSYSNSSSSSSAILTWSNGKKIKICGDMGAWSSSYGIYQIFTKQYTNDSFWPTSGRSSGKIWFEEVEGNAVSMISLDVGYAPGYTNSYVRELNIIQKDPDTNTETVIFSAGPYTSLAASKSAIYNDDKPGVVKMVFGGGIL